MNNNIKKSKLSEYEKLQKLENQDVLYNVFNIIFVELKSSNGQLKFVPVQYNTASGLYQDILTQKVYQFNDNYSDFNKLATDYSKNNIKFECSKQNDYTQSSLTYSFKELSNLVQSSTYKYFTIKGNTNSRAKMQSYLIQNENDILFDTRIITKKGVEKFAKKSENIINKIMPVIKEYAKTKEAYEKTIAQKIYEGEKFIF